MREIIRAPHSGFCFGVKQAIEKAEREAAASENIIYSFGPLIHNSGQTRVSLSEELKTIRLSLNIFAKAVVRERRIPFEIRSDSNRGMEAFDALRAVAKKNGMQDMSLDEINEEIRRTREGIGN